MAHPSWDPALSEQSGPRPNPVPGVCCGWWAGLPQTEETLESTGSNASPSCPPFIPAPGWGLLVTPPLPERRYSGACSCSPSELLCQEVSGRPHPSHVGLGLRQ